MLMWAKLSLRPRRTTNVTGNTNEKSAPSTATNNVATAGSQVNKTAHDNLQSLKQHKNTGADKMCIFSSGPPERTLSIDIDPVLQNYMHNTSQKGCKETNQRVNETNLNGAQNTRSNTSTQLQAAVASLTSFVANSSQALTVPSSQTNLRPPITQQTPPVNCNGPTVEQHPSLSSNTQRYTANNLPNFSVLTNKKTATPILERQLAQPPLLGYLVDRQPPSYDSHPQTHTKQVHQQATLLYDHSQRLRVQSTQQPQLQCNPEQYQQSQYLQSQSGSEYSQTWSLGQSSLITPLYNQSQAQVLQQNQYQQQQQQQQQYPADSWPTMEDLLSTDATQQLPYQTNTGQWQSRQQAQPLQTSGTVWNQQGQIFQGQVPSQTQKGSPRSASTDSGFISPLNFSVPTDPTRQDPTMQTSGPENAMPMIVHVTSLSEKAAFVDMGTCVVCKKRTKQMCMGCMKVYYCNFQCQTTNWPEHASHCSQQNTTST
ncbi:zinc finger protein 1-like isoform X1 [Leguminivora glycinivorella]|uniref:zinc finger protein 1-like isoform X1 n=1 Tax=Leguminivora glycinivorella TaxID=1035111 RepID=UPI002010B30A|nr:zinc finger protein 1-like isoform X1 [Leguminivora glycinivorella]XP_047991308.1 zinc finger protein 1-like isoform X1 [Leguminivora glycinivorella]